MTDFVSILGMVVGLLGGGGVFITFVLYRKSQKRFKNAEAFEKEVIALRMTVGELRDQIRFCNERLFDMQKMIVDKDAYIATLTMDKHTIEIKHAKNKAAINTAYACPYCEDKADCPVLKKRAANEEEYLNEIKRS